MIETYYVTSRVCTNPPQSWHAVHRTHDFLDALEIAEGITDNSRVAVASGNAVETSIVAASSIGDLHALRYDIDLGIA